jgi:hypothetical protein
MARVQLSCVLVFFLELFCISLVRYPENVFHVASYQPVREGGVLVFIELS